MKQQSQAKKPQLELIFSDIDLTDSDWDADMQLLDITELSEAALTEIVGAGLPRNHNETMVKTQYS
ncbi:MAG: hypothetical protein AAF215_19795 [Cyanobacteria bacterium P01_A01_bin.123]